jgi:hypothetical protein
VLFRSPKLIRDTARDLLRHYPNEYEMRQASDGAPEVFQERMEPLYRFVKQYEQDKND